MNDDDIDALAYWDGRMRLVDLSQEMGFWIGWLRVELAKDPDLDVSCLQYQMHMVDDAKAKDLLTLAIVSLERLTRDGFD